MNQNDKNKLELYGMTHNQIVELKAVLVDRYVDNMSTKDLVQYVMDDLNRYYEDMPDAEFIDEAKDYWDDAYDEIIQEIKEGDIEFTDNDDNFIDINNTGGKY